MGSIHKLNTFLLFPSSFFFSFSILLPSAKRVFIKHIIMSQTTESSADLHYTSNLQFDYSSDDSGSYTIVHNFNNSSIKYEVDSVDGDTSDEDQDENSASRVSEDDHDEEEEAEGSNEESSSEEDENYLELLIKAYDSLLSRYKSTQAVALASRVAVRRIYQDSLIQKAVHLVGEDAVQKLAIIGSLQGSNTTKISRNIQVVCTGDEVEGVNTIKQLVQSSIISQKGSKYDSSNEKIHLNLIAAAMPYAAFQYMDDEHTKDIPQKKSRHRIATTLPMKLQYIEAGALPLGAKTRKAHLHWLSQFFKSINCKFNPTIYKRNMRQAVIYENIKWLTKKLDDIEASLTLNTEEKDINIKQFFKKYYAIAQKARTKESKHNKARNSKVKRAERRRQNATRDN